MAAKYRPHVQAYALPVQHLLSLREIERERRRLLRDPEIALHLRGRARRSTSPSPASGSSPRTRRGSVRWPNRTASASGACVSSAWWARSTISLSTPTGRSSTARSCARSCIGCSASRRRGCRPVAPGGPARDRGGRGPGQGRSRPRRAAGPFRERAGDRRGLRQRLAGALSGLLQRVGTDASSKAPSLRNCRGAPRPSVSPDRPVRSASCSRSAVAEIGRPPRPSRDARRPAVPARSHR